MECEWERNLRSCSSDNMKCDASEKLFDVLEDVGYQVGYFHSKSEIYCPLDLCLYRFDIATGVSD